MVSKTVTIDELQKFLVEKALIFPTAEIYGSFAGFFDYGPAGVEIKNSVKAVWWNHFVQSRSDVVGMDGSVITHPKVWEASGHTSKFQDPMVECLTCKAKHRADHVIEEKKKISADGMELKKMAEIIRELKCPRCGGKLSEPKYQNLMLKTSVGSAEGETSYLRPETAQLIFADFDRIYKSSRLSLPFGIAQVGRSFRNEISPRNFVFRAREFEQMEVEFFFKPGSKCPGFESVKEMKIPLMTYKMQAEESEAKPIALKTLVKENITTEWHAYWLGEIWHFLLSLGLREESLRLRQHRKEELSHYALDTWDVEFLYPFGWKELAGIANRGSFDLGQHSKFSGKDLGVTEEGEKISPHVIEPSFGLDRLVLALICDAWDEDTAEGEKRQVLRLKPEIAPVQAAVFPLVNKDGMQEKALEVYNGIKKSFRTFYDDKGSVGRRYRRQDSIGTPFCITIDGETMKKDTVTIRDRDTMEQKRIKVKGIKEEIRERIDIP
jgi:glycyl-tRNA synthetase